MSKIFITNVSSEKPLPCISLDYSLSSKQEFPVSYVVASKMQPGDDNKIIVCLASESKKTAENYELLKKEITGIVGDKVAFKKVYLKPLQEDYFNGSKVLDCFKEVLAEIHENDIVYTDLTYAMQPFALSLFTAVYYAVRTTKGTQNGGVFSCVKYDNKMEIISLDTLFHLAEIAGNMRPGSRKMMDQLFNNIFAEHMEENVAEMSSVVSDENEDKDIDED